MDEQKEGAERSRYAVACLMVGSGQASMTLSVKEAFTKEEAIGAAVEYALSAKPGMQVGDVLWAITDPQEQCAGAVSGDNSVAQEGSLPPST